MQAKQFCSGADLCLQRNKTMKKITKEEGLEILFFAFILCVWLAWAYILPFNEGPDEYMRSRIVEYIVEYGGLPTGYQQEIMDYSWGFTYGFRPILPQILEALFVRAAMFFTEDSFLILFAGRLTSVICGLVFAVYVRLTAKKLFSSSGMQWLFTLLVVCLPQAAFLFTYLNCDSMALMASAMIVWYLLSGREDGFSIRTCVKLSLSFAICILSYYNAYGFLLAAALVFFGFYLERSRRGEACWGEFWRKGFLILGITFALSGWWFIRNYFLYDGDILGLRTQDLYAEQYAMDILKPSNRRTYRNQGRSMLYMLFRSDWIVSVAKSFIGVLGPLWYALRWWMYLGYALILGTGLLGGVFEGAARLHSRGKERRVNYETLFWHVGMAAAILAPNILNFWYSYATDYQPQGRYSMPMLIPFMYYITKGISFLIRRLCRRTGAWMRSLAQAGTTLVCLWIAGAALFCVIRIMWPAYKDVEDKSAVRVYTMEELYGEDWEEKVSE